MPTETPRTTGAMRTLLAETMARALDSAINHEDAKVLLAAANRITESMHADNRARQFALRAGFEPVALGTQTLGQDDAHDAVSQPID